ncbi:MAG: WG repeat-containing protein [Prevotella sp.]|nr:WG repeat-containing protein [Prevotella sp.]
MKRKFNPAFWLVASIIITFSCQKKSLNSPLYEIEENNFYGFIDTLGNHVIEPQFLAVSPFHNNLSAVLVDTLFKDAIGVDETGKKEKHNYLYMKYGYINSVGDFVIKPHLVHRVIHEKNVTYDKNELQSLMQQNMFSFTDGRAAYLDTVNNKYGFIDTLGNVCIEAKYHDVKAFDCGLAPASQIDNNNQQVWGYIDKQGNHVTAFVYSDLNEFRNGYATGIMYVKEIKQQEPISVITPEYINEQDSVIITEELCCMEGGTAYRVATVLFDSKAHIIRNDLNSNYRYYSFSKDEGIAVAELIFDNPLFQQSRFRFAKTTGKFIDSLEGVSEQKLLQDYHNRKILGFLSNESMIMDATWMSNGFAGITPDPEYKEWFFVDKHLIVQAPINGWESYEGILPFSNGLAAIKHNGKWGYVNDKFQIVIPLKYDSCEIANKYLNKVYQKLEGTNLVITSWINRKDSIIWQSSVDDSIVNNMYSSKPSNLYGQWIYENSNNIFMQKNILYYVLFAVIVILVILIIIYKKI